MLIVTTLEIAIVNLGGLWAPSVIPVNLAILVALSVISVPLDILAIQLVRVSQSYLSIVCWFLTLNLSTYIQLRKLNISAPTKYNCVQMLTFGY